MADDTNKHRNFLADTVEVVDKFMAAYEDLQAWRTEYDALDYGNMLDPVAFDGANEHLEIADVVAVATTQAALEGVLSAGHRTNLLRVRR